MNEQTGGWRSRMISARWIWGQRALRPADISSGLLATMLDKGSLLEDVRYQKVVPNHYVVELNPGSYSANFQPIERQIVEQWSEKMLRHLVTTNSRLGRKEYRFGGQLRLEIRPAGDLAQHQARVLTRIAALDDGQAAPQTVVASIAQAPSAQAPSAQGLAPAAGPGCLTTMDGMGRWPLRPGVLTLGRSRNADIFLDWPALHELRLVSGVHATLRVNAGRTTLFDGSPDGKPSLNGTYVNGQRVGMEGRDLKVGDLIILAAVDPAEPRADAPGAAALRFSQECV